MTLATDIQKGAIDSEASLPTILRMMKVLAAELGVADLNDWVDRELNGYGPQDELPSYRTLHEGEDIGLFSGPFGRLTKNVPIPVASVPEEVRKHLGPLRVRQGVRWIESMIEDSSMKKMLGRSWPAEWVIHARDSIPLADGSLLVEAWTRFPSAAFEGILDSIRNRTLDFIVKLQQAHPDIRTSDEATNEISATEAQTIFNVTFLGDNNRLVAAGAGSQQSIAMSGSIEQGVLDSLFEFLKNTGVQSEDLRELQAAIEGDDPPSEEGRFGQKVAAWMGSMVAKAAQGVWKVSAGAASELLSKALLKYYGLGDA